MQTESHTHTANIRQALAALIGEEPLLPCLAEVLQKCRSQRGITFAEIQTAAGTEAHELLLLAWDFRLLLPRRSSRCAEWDDRIMRFEPGEIYDTVNIVDHLLSVAAQTGAWNVDKAAAGLYEQMGEPEYEKIPALIRRITQLSENGQISAAGIHAACKRAGISGRAGDRTGDRTMNRTGAMIAILKGGGIISPKLMSSSPAEKSGSPVYELHPAITGALT